MYVGHAVSTLVVLFYHRTANKNKIRIRLTPVYVKSTDCLVTCSFLDVLRFKLSSNLTHLLLDAYFLAVQVFLLVYSSLSVSIC